MYVNRKKFRTPTEKSVVQEKRNTIRRQLEKWRDVQQVYMPGVSVLRGTDTDPDAQNSLLENRSELAKLWLPSQIPTSHRTTTCFRGIEMKERRFRLAQVHDALCELRRARRVYRGVMNHFKIDVAGTGQSMITRTRTITINAGNRITRSFNRYVACRAALLSLDPNGEWTKKYLVLLPEDNRGPSRDIDDDETGEGYRNKPDKVYHTKPGEGQRIQPGEGYRMPSWIWLVSPNAPVFNGSSVSLGPSVGSSMSADQMKLSLKEFNDAMRSEWAQIQARAERWEEEYELTKMEMVRTWLFLQSKANEWEGRQVLNRNVPTGVGQGLVAYAVKQAAISRSLAHKFLFQWLRTVKILDIDHTWFYVETQSILHQLQMDPTLFRSEWNSISSSLTLPEFSPEEPVQPPVTTTTTSSSIPEPSSAPTASATRPKRPIPKASRTRAPRFSIAPLDLVATSTIAEGSGALRQLRPRQNPSYQDDSSEDGSQADPEAKNDNYEETGEQDEYDSDDLDIECDD